MLGGMAHEEEAKDIKHHIWKPPPKTSTAAQGGASKAKVQMDLNLCLLKISIYSVLSFSECFYMLSSFSVLHAD